MVSDSKELNIAGSKTISPADFKKFASEKLLELKKQSLEIDQKLAKALDDTEKKEKEKEKTTVKHVKVVEEVNEADDNEKEPEFDEATKLLILSKLNSKMDKAPTPGFQTSFKTNLERFEYLCKDLPSPDLFIKYNFYFMIASCLGRKVWWGTSNAYVGNLYPNLYLVFVTPPGIGKSLPANTAGRILSSLVEFKLNNTGKVEPAPMLNMGPDCITFEKLIIRAASYNETVPWPGGPMKYYHHSSTVFCMGDEMGMLFSEQTKRVVSFLMKSWDCGDFEGDTISRGVVKIKNVCLNFLGCTTPLIMKDLMRTKVLDNGFTGRTIFIYGDKKRKKIFGDLSVSENQLDETKLITSHLRKLCKLKPTNVVVKPEAMEWLRNWVEHKEDVRLNRNPRLEDYYARKAAQLKKLAVLHHYADKLDNVIDVEDFVAAEQLLLMTEPGMHKALVQAGENPVYTIAEEMKLYLKTNGEVDRRKLLLDFFSMGNNVTLQLALTFLTETAQITSRKEEHKTIVKLSKNDQY